MTEFFQTLIGFTCLGAGYWCLRQDEKIAVIVGWMNLATALLLIADTLWWHQFGMFVNDLP